MASSLGVVRTGGTVRVAIFEASLDPKFSVSVEGSVEQIEIINGAWEEKKKINAAKRRAVTVLTGNQ